MLEYRTTNMRKCRRMKFLCIIPVAPQGRGNDTFLIFAMLLHSKKAAFLFSLCGIEKRRLRVSLFSEAHYLLVRCTKNLDFTVF